MHAAVMNAVVAAAVGNARFGQIVLRLPLLCHVMSVSWQIYVLYFLSLAVQVRIMKDWDPSGKQGPKIPLPDVVTVHTPKEDEIMSDKPQIGKEKEKEGYQPYMEDAPASMPVS